MIHQPKCANYDIYTIRTSSESHLHRKDHLHKNPIHYGIIGDFEADNGIDNSSIGNKTTNIYKQNPVHNGYLIISQLDDFLKSGFYESPLEYDNVDWYVNGVRKLENKVALYFTLLRKISLWQKMMKILRKIIFVDFVKNIFFVT